jgi:hypothetical protein
MAMTRKQRTQLSAFIERKRRARRRATRATSVQVDALAPVGFWFSPQRHGLTVEQCKIATEVLRRRNREQPIRGISKQAQFRRALRIGGIISAVKGGRVGNAHFGYRLHGHRGGNVMRDHALGHLRTIAPLGARVAQAAREGQKALEAWEQRQSQPQSYEAWQQDLAAWPQQGRPTDFMAY